jgi:hypothetical protein
MPGRPESDKPFKDGFYDNVADSLRYAGENVFREAQLDPELLREAARTTYTEYTPPESPWAWMERRG